MLPGISVSPETTQLLTDKAANFADLISRLLNPRGIRTKQFVSQGELAQAWLAALIAGESAPPDVDALRLLVPDVFSPKVPLENSPVLWV